MAKLVRRYLSEVTFSEADRLIRYPHNRPLYLTASVNDCVFSRVLLDGGASINTMPIRYFYATRLSEIRIVPHSLAILGYDN